MRLHESQDVQRQEREFLGRPSTRLKVTVILATAVIGVAAEVGLPGWGRVTAITVLLVGTQLIIWQPWWRARRFWEIGAALLIAHVGFVMAFRSWINSISVPFLFLLLLGEVLLSGAALSFTDPSLRPKS